MTDKDPHIAITEIDLLGYADGLLDADPARKRAVESFLSAHPAEADRVHAYIEQNREIRRLYGPVIDEPLPERLREVLHRERGHGAAQWMRAAAGVAILAAAAAGGWLVGFEQTQVPSPAQSFVEQALTIHPQSRNTKPAALRIDTVSAAGAIDRPASTGAADLDPPDLSALGYTIRDRRVVGEGDERMVQMTYVRSDGRRLSLFLGSRWRSDERKVTFSDGGDLTMAHWLDGPMIYGVVTEGDEMELTAVAETIQAAAKRARRGASRIAIQGETHAKPLEDAGLADELPQTRLVVPEPAVVAPRDRLGPIRATR